jgi:SAM-dependent methyltransferase
MSLLRSWRKRRNLLSINIPSLTGLVVRRRILFKKQEVTILFSRRSVARRKHKLSSMANEITARHLDLHRNILRELGHSLRPGAQVLDFGCGAGKMVEEYGKAGYEAFGCDLRIEHESERLRRIDSETRALPFADSSFDFVFSDQVLEHVQNHARAFAEMRRVMKPGAVSLHIFPAKLKPTEGHVFVPLGGLIQNRWWLTLWALLGLRNSFQQGKGFREVVELNSDYLQHRTNYLSRSRIVAAASAYFENLAFVEKAFIKHTYGGARRLYPLTEWFPFVASLYSTFYCRVIFFQKSDSAEAGSTSG